MNTPELSVQEQFIQFSKKHIPKYLRRYLKHPRVLKFLSELLCIKEILQLKDKLKGLSSFDLVDAIIKYTGISCNYENLNRIPTKGRLLLVANHPLGGADWLLIVQCLRTIRKDVKVVINKDVNTLIVNMRDLFIPVDTYAKFNELAKKQIGESLEREEAVIIFPSGGISILTINGVKDRKWKNGVAYFSRKHHTDILPVYIGGRFNLAFYFYPIRLRRLLLVRNLLHPTFKNARIVIGDKVPYEGLLRETDLSIISSRLMTITYQLGVVKTHP